MNTMIKSWLITISTSVRGTEQYYKAYSESNPLESGKLYNWFFDEATENLWDNYGFYWKNDFQEEYDEVKDIYNDFEEFYNEKIQEWKDYCSISCEECDEEEFHIYAPGVELDIIYDEREK